MTEDHQVIRLSLPGMRLARSSLIRYPVPVMDDGVASPYHRSDRVTEATVEQRPERQGIPQSNDPHSTQRRYESTF